MTVAAVTIQFLITFKHVIRCCYRVEWHEFENYWLRFAKFALKA